MIKADLHVHTEYSIDCNSRLEKILQHCIKFDIGCIAVADHNSIVGAKKLCEMSPPFKVIVAEEILTMAGEIIGLFLEESIPANLPVEKAIAMIKSQNGIVCLPHPFDTFRTSLFRDESFYSVLQYIDVIEVFNSRSLSPDGSKKAYSLANDYNKLVSAGSDAHTVSEIGKAYVEMPVFNTANDFLNSLSQGTIHGKKSNILVHFASTWAKFRNSF